MQEYTAYITRGTDEYEVTASLYGDGYGYSDTWSDTGTTFEVVSDPSFRDFYAEDDDGQPLVFSDDEMKSIVGQMIDQYWENY